MPEETGQAADGPTGWPFIDGLLGGPAGWDGAEWTFVVGVAALAVSAMPPVRRPVLAWLRKQRQPCPTFGDYAMPNRPVEGRAGEVSRIAHMAGSGRRVVLCGGGGRGKSTLARLYVDERHRRRRLYRGVCWIDAATEEGLRRAMAWLAKTLDPSLAGETDTDVLCARARDLVAAGGGRWLLVYDNAEGPEALRTWLPARRRGLEVLITSRNPGWEGEEFSVYPVGALDTAGETSAGVEVLWRAASC